ncbi:MAG: hypothetical protein C4547_14200 [Phycisphaerales bacterium]|nr:MAG: hypothetical protein C4547_14200 [Phycisphaerales bacterium]
MTTRGCFQILVALVGCVSSAAGQTAVRITGDTWTAGAQSVERPAAAGGRSDAAALAAPFMLTARAWHKQPVPGGGTLNPVAYGDGASIDASGTLAFTTIIDGVPRNQGIFLADEDGLHPIAIGCGSGGGTGDPGTHCGDPTPIGGTFTGFFRGTYFIPAVNDAGDVMFLSDVVDGPSPRGLFLYRRVEDDIIKIAAVGDPSPMGGRIGMVGPGSINNARQAVFLAYNEGSTVAQIFRWQDGAVSKVVAAGDPAPGGGTLQILAYETASFGDGTTMPVGAVPDINDSGQIAFFAIVSGGRGGQGLFVSRDGVHEWAVWRGQPSPIGGTFLNFWHPLINNEGELAFFTDVDLGGHGNSAWVVGRPGNWRKAVAFFDRIDDGEVRYLAVSRNPMRALDDCGNLLVWCMVLKEDNSERSLQVLITPSGQQIVTAGDNDPTPLGGVLNTFQGWPSMNNGGQMVLGSGILGGIGGTESAHFLVELDHLKGDGDGDRDVDLKDLGLMVECLAGPADCPPQFACTVFDFDGNGRVDLRDAAGFQGAFTGGR